MSGPGAVTMRRFVLPAVPMFRIFYSLLIYLLLPLLLLRAVWRGRASGAERPRERLGFVAPDTRRPLLVHCVSVGETIAAQPLLAALLARGEALWVTSTTLTGAERVRHVFGERVRRSFLPVDTPDAVARFLARVNPRALLLIETEIWPNLVHAARKRGIPVVLVNARLSEKSARGYARFAWLTRPALAQFTAVLAQADADAGRFRLLGAPEVLQTGNLKFDVAHDAGLASRAAELRSAWGRRLVWLAASTHERDEEAVLAAHGALRARFPDLLLVLVPRHPERFDAVAARAARAGFGCARRSAGERVTDMTAVYLGDTMGELPLLYATSDVAFVGGSFSGTGGHNMLEPASLGLPVVTGPSLYNFQSVSDALVAAGAQRVAGDDRELAETVGHWLNDGDARRSAGQAGRDFVQRNRGALARSLAAIDKVLAR